VNAKELAFAISRYLFVWLSLFILDQGRFSIIFVITQLKDFEMRKISSLGFFGISVFLGSVAIGQTSDVARLQNAALVADAQSRSNLNSSGHDANGFFITNGNGARLNIGGDVQFRYTWNTNREGNSDNNVGFSDPLARIRFSGNINEQIDFMLEGGFNRQGGNFTLFDAYAGIRAFDGGRFQVGQFKLPFMKEVNVSDRYQLAIDRSIVSYVFGQGRSQGVQLSYNTDSFRLVGAVSDGFNTVNTEYTDPSESNTALTVRGEYSILGNNGDFSQFTSETNDENALLAGAAFHYQEGSTQSTSYSYTGDLTWKNHGWNAFVSGVGRSVEDPAATYEDFGLAAQGGYRVTERIEPFVRYDEVFADSARGFSNNNFAFATVGLNYYLYGQAAKITTDMVYSFDDTSNLANMTNFSNTGLLGSTGDGEMSFRMQFQLLF